MFNNDDTPPTPPPDPYLLIPKRSFYLVSVVKKVFNTHLKLLMYLPRVIISSLTIPPAIHIKKRIYNNKKKRGKRGFVWEKKQQLLMTTNGAFNTKKSDIFQCITSYRSVLHKVAAMSKFGLIWTLNIQYLWNERNRKTIFFSQTKNFTLGRFLISFVKIQS